MFSLSENFLQAELQNVIIAEKVITFRSFPEASSASCETESLPAIRSKTESK